MDIINKFLPIVLSILMSANLTGCGKKEATAQEVETSISSKTAYVADSLSIDEINSLLKINGVAISFPCSVSKLINSLGDGYTYKVGFADYERNLVKEVRPTFEDYIYYDYCIPITIVYKDNLLFDVYIHENDYTGNIESSLVYPVSCNLINEMWVV